MGDWIARLVQGNVAEVKVVLTSVAFALAAYQVVLAAIGYRRLRPAVLGPEPASARTAPAVTRSPCCS